MTGSIREDIKQRQTPQFQAAFFGTRRTSRLPPLQVLIVLGFLLAVVPPFLGVLYAVFAIQENSALSRTLNAEVYEQTKIVRLVLQKASDIERKARLFVLLSDPALRQPYERQSYENVRATFRQALDELLKLHVDNKIALMVNELSEKENLIYQQLVSADNQDRTGLPLDEAFQGLRESAASLSREFEEHVEHRFNELRNDAEALERGLLVKGAVLFAFSLLCICSLYLLVARSFRQLETAVRRLGSGESATPVRIEGPADFQALGRRLEWLRLNLLELETSKRQFIENTAREIEIRLPALRNVAEQLGKPATAPYPADQESLAKMLGGAVATLQALTNELAGYHGSDAATESHSKTRVNMKELLESVLAGLQTRLLTKSLSVKKLLKPVEITGIDRQLRLIAEQLLDNAIHFSPVGGEIRIILRTTGDHLELEIEDEGPGIAPDEREKVFEPFYRGTAATREENRPGSGLGLAKTRDCVAAHHGRIEILDTREDQIGARICVQIPLDRND